MERQSLCANVTSAKANKGRRGTVRFVSGIIAVMMLSFVLLVSAFVAFEAHHDCEGEDCPICACIEQCRAILRMAAKTGGKQVSFMIPVAVFLAVNVYVSMARSDSLVSRKVRLDD
jgi:hypothetical protein